MNDDTAMRQPQAGTAGQLQAILQAALSARSQLGWSRWLQGEIQAFIPHHALIAAWGDFESGELAYDVVTRNAQLSMQALPPDIIEPLARTVHAQWLAAGQGPLSIDTRALRSVGSALFASSPAVLVHGVRDHRSRYDCIYIFVGPAGLAEPHPRELCALALPYIDIAFRLLPDRGRKDAEVELSATDLCTSSFATVAAPQPARGGNPGAGTGRKADEARAAQPRHACVLSARELEVMTWVRSGKTNPEIAMILHLSMFTVKNHMRRIYRKLDVLNRAQAVGLLDAAHGLPPFAGGGRGGAFPPSMHPSP